MIINGDCLEEMRNMEENSVDSIVTEKYCKKCGKIFKIMTSRLKHGRGIFCSAECKKTYVNPNKHERECPVCLVKFNCSKGSKKRFCSPACSYAARGIVLVKRVARRPYRTEARKDDIIPEICCICKCLFIKRSRKKKQRHCSVKCYNVTKSRRMSGRKNYFYKNGGAKKKTSYRGEGWGETRRRVYERDNWSCAICGVKCGKKKIQCHHIVPFRISKDNSDENLITLCISCHGRIESRFEIFNADFFEWVK
jgi:5-methylcytosine-specific restriction endonuclease McrA